jgi:molybdenum cofactor guanylyltransferase
MAGPGKNQAGWFPRFRYVILTAMQPKITGVILAGGQASRMGGNDKGLITLRGKMLYQHAIERLAPQVDTLMISANRNLNIYQQSGLPVIHDTVAGFSGPLAGILATLNSVSTEWAVFTPCDTPDLPLNLVSQLWFGKRKSIAAYADDGERAHAGFALLHVSLMVPLEKYLAKGERKLTRFLSSVNAHPVIFKDSAMAFRNLNTPEDCIQWAQSSRK